jgi:hypothetical protein
MAAPSEDEPDFSEPTEPYPDGWVPLIHYGWGRAFVTARPFFVASAGAYFVVVSLWGLPVGLFIAGFLGYFLLAFFLTLAFYRLKPVPQANFSTSDLRMGRTTIAMSEITRAKLLVQEEKKSRTVVLQFGPESKRRARVLYLIRGSDNKADRVERARLVAEVLRRSNVSLPTSPDDPEGRFAWVNFPNNITRDDAIHVVLNPPTFGDPLPIAPSHMFDSPRPRPKRAPSVN